MKDVVVARLDHGIAVGEIKKAERPKIADGLMTSSLGICLALTAADCVPQIYWDKKSKILAISHNGWRGTIAGMTTNILTSMKNKYGSDPSDILVGIGPSICQKHYEVGYDVWIKIPSNLRGFAKPRGDKKWLLDLWGINRQQAVDYGVPAENIEISGVCTYEDDNFFSSRREKEGAGRFILASMIYNR